MPKTSGLERSVTATMSCDCPPCPCKHPTAPPGPFVGLAVFLLGPVLALAAAGEAQAQDGSRWKLSGYGSAGVVAQ
jgi:hypothetical protein